MLNILGKDLKLSKHKDMPNFLKSKYFRYGFLAFFMSMFIVMIFNTYLVFSNARDLKQVITLFWSFKLPFAFNDVSNVSPWVAQFAY